MKEYVKLDSLDKRILTAIQKDGTLTVQQVADIVGLSTTPCWRRIKHLEDAGVIDRRVAILNPYAIGLKGTVFVFVRTDQHDASWVERFTSAISEIPEILECHRLTGNIDYLLKCVVRDVDHYDDVYKRLIARVPSLIEMSASFSMERLKEVTAIDCSTAL